MYIHYTKCRISRAGIQQGIIYKRLLLAQIAEDCSDDSTFKPWNKDDRNKKLKKLVLGREIVKIHQHWWRRSKKKAGSQDHNASQCSPSSASCLSYQTSSPPHPHPAPLKSSSQPSQALPSRRPTPPGAFLPHLLLLPSPLLTRSLFTYKRDGPLDPAFVWVPRLLSELHFFWYFHILDISPKRVFHQKVA